nr:hypothetical protein [Tanacetum cinerariifolium]
MSDNIPFEIQAEIMKRLPVKSLIQFRSVSKLWKSLIDSSAFIAEYQRTELQQHILLVRDAFEHKDSEKQTAVIWNPTIRKSVAIDMPARSEEFTKICLPGTLAIDCDKQMGICKFGESLIVHQSEVEGDEPEYGICMMENGDPVSFKKIYTIKSNLPANTSVSGVFGSTKSGVVLILVSKWSRFEEEEKVEEEEECEFSVYDPNSEHIDYISTFNVNISFFVSSYTETLLLLDR